MATAKINVPTNRWIVLALLLLVGWALYGLSSVLMPFITAAILAYLMNPVVGRLQALKIPRVLAVVVVFLLLFLLFALALLFLIPLLEQQFTVLMSQIPGMIVAIQESFLPWLKEHTGYAPELGKGQIQQLLGQNWQKASDLAGKALSAVSESGMAVALWLTNLVLIPVVLFYLLRDWPAMINGIQALLPRRVEPLVSALCKECDEVLSAFLRGQFLVMLCLGLLYSLGLWLIGVELALLIGMVSGLVSIVPYLGFIVGIISASLAAFFQFHDLWSLCYVALVFIVVQSIEGMLLTPWFVGNKIGMHPVGVIFAVLAGAHLFGFVGILLALPVAAVIMVLLRHVKNYYLGTPWYIQREEESSQ